MRPELRRRSELGGADAENTLIHVQQELILPIAARLIGTSVSQGESRDVTGGLDWVAQFAAGFSRQSSSEIEVARLFPEDVFRFCYDKIDLARLSVREYCKQQSTHQIRPPDVVTVTGELDIPGVTTERYDPFNPPQLDIREQYRVYGYRTFAAALGAEGFEIPVHFLAASLELVAYANKSPVEVVGVVKWSPSYEAGGHTLNAILLCAALLLAR